MCGIAGVMRVDGPGPNRQTLEEMASRITHRGPDESGVHCQDLIGLSHTRLSIVDLQSGQQPMVSRCGQLVVVFNGEIFNHVELRRELQAKGHRFETRCDTEVILHMYEAYGEQCVSAFNGQWAFALWDGRNRKLFLSRDRMGIRPLHYTWAGGDFLFASELKSLLAHPAVEPEIDLEALDDIFTFWVTLPPRTILRNVCELPPGHNLTVTADGDVKQWAYWRLDYPEPDFAVSEETYRDELLDLLTDAVRLRLRADVPVGAYLSGGLDSSVTTALVKRLNKAELRSFSVTFADGDYDESAYQRAVVDHLGTDHATIHCTGAEIGRSFPHVIWHTEKPIIRTAPAPLRLLSGLVRRSGFKVVLTGEGADEVLGGYDIYKEAKIRRFWAAEPDSAFRPLLLKRLYPYMPALQAQSTPYLKAFFHVEPADLKSPLFSHLPRWELTRKTKAFYSSDVKDALRTREPYEALLAQLPQEYGRWDPFCQAQYLESRYLLPGYILSSQGDRMAMANSVEGRFPFLDHRVVELAARLPAKLKMQVLNEKHLLKRAADGLVPRQVLERPKQPYRAPDVPSFFFGDREGSDMAYLDEALSPDTLMEYGLFNPRAVQALAGKCRKGGRGTGVKDSMALVGVVSAQLVVRQFVKLRGEQPDHARD